jgi:hypothetical protein
MRSYVRAARADWRLQIVGAEGVEGLDEGLEFFAAAGAELEVVVDEGENLGGIGAGGDELGVTVGELKTVVAGELVRLGGVDGLQQLFDPAGIELHVSTPHIPSVCALVIAHRPFPVLSAPE